MSAGLLFVGSIPYPTVEHVFRDFGPAFGSSLMAMPDGEVGPRSHWISRVHYSVFANHPDFETVRQPQKENGVERLNPRSAADSWQFRIRPDVKEVNFGDKGWRLGFARDAANSYFIFRAMRSSGLYPEALRFQVSVPSVNSAVPNRIFLTQNDVEIVRKGYMVALKAEIENIASLIPHKDLAVQIDCTTEMQDTFSATPGHDITKAVNRHLGQIAELAMSVPEEAMLGYHMCLGTLGGWPKFEPDNLSGAVTMANAFIHNSGRPVNWLHIPILPRTDDEFYRALSDLNPNGTRIFLGLLHNVNTLQERIQIAKKYLSSFGLAAYCGFGRLEPSELNSIKADHLKAITLLEGN
jgi:hypothetical protein